MQFNDVNAQLNGSSLQYITRIPHLVGCDLEFMTEDVTSRLELVHGEANSSISALTLRGTTKLRNTDNRSTSHNITENVWFLYSRARSSVQRRKHISTTCSSIDLPGEKRAAITRTKQDDWERTRSGS